MRRESHDWGDRVCRSCGIRHDCRQKFVTHRNFEMMPWEIVIYGRGLFSIDIDDRFLPLSNSNETEYKIVSISNYPSGVGPLNWDWQAILRRIEG